MFDTMHQLLQDSVQMLLDGDKYLLYVLSSSYFIVGVPVFFILVYGVTAPYGRYSRSGWGSRVNGKVAWFVQEIPAFVIPVCILIRSIKNSQQYQIPNLLLASLFIVHYFHRACVYPFLIKGGKPSPMVTFVWALLFCVVNGYLQVTYILQHAQYDIDWWTRPHILLGIPLFLLGMGINIHSDHILRNLRAPGETGYKIPKGGLFDFVSGANFFGEILEWAGFAIATWCIPALAFSFFTCCNIGPRAFQHHQYYVQKFEDYPKNRKAVIPFLI